MCARREANSNPSPALASGASVTIRFYRFLILTLFFPATAMTATEGDTMGSDWSTKATSTAASLVRRLEDRLAPIGLATQPKTYLIRGRSSVRGQASVEYSLEGLTESLSTSPPKRILFYAQGAAFDSSLNAANTVAGLADKLGQQTLIIATDSFDESCGFPFPVTSQRGGWILAQLVKEVSGVLEATNLTKVQLDFFGHSHGARTIVEALHYLPACDPDSDSLVREQSRIYLLSPSVASVFVGSWFSQINQMQRMLTQFVPSNALLGYWDILFLPSGRLPAWLTAEGKARVHIAVPDPDTVQGPPPVACPNGFCGDLRRTVSPRLGGAFLSYKEQHDGMVETSARVIGKMWFDGQPFSYRKLRSGDHLQALFSPELADLMKTK